MNPEDLDDLKMAKDKPENTSLAAKVTNLIGAPLEKGFEKLSVAIRGKIEVITQTALMASMKTVLLSMKDAPNTVFIDHFQQMAHAHFTIRRLERKYSRGEVWDAYHEA